MRHAVVILLTAGLIGLAGGCQKDATYTETPLEQAGDNMPAARTPAADSAREQTPQTQPGLRSQTTPPPTGPGATTPSAPQQETSVDQEPTQTDADQTIDVPPVVGGSKEKPE
ncbi:MAG: hypothetical protein ACYC4U_26960 [Pirellulaceae bacterium]